KPNSNLQAGEYKVIAGDTLWSICQRYYQNPYLYLKLAKFNQIKNPNLIEVNQILKIPLLSILKGSNKTNFNPGSAARSPAEG
ncbi:MAG TPA: LysM domain-containing protein, partial [Desulfobulbaceae bacterium]|nr:LysM domain-containing protein [Desulfobulbaceae bacterium]